MSITEDIDNVYNERKTSKNVNRAIQLLKDEGKIFKLWTGATQGELIVEYVWVSDLSCMTTRLFQECGLYVHCYQNISDNGHKRIFFREADKVYG